jgi:hypothetical protein
LPGSAVSVSPTIALPEIDGSFEFRGALSSAIRGVGLEFALVEPSAFRAVTIETIVRPTSAERSR